MHILVEEVNSVILLALPPAGPGSAWWRTNVGRMQRSGYRVTWLNTVPETALISAVSVLGFQTEPAVYKDGSLLEVLTLHFNVHI